MSKQSRAREFGQKERAYIKERDGGCIFCQMGYHMEEVSGHGQQLTSIMHYIPRSQNGLGIPENGAVGCQIHHEMLDNGNSGRRQEMLGLFKAYLMRHHPDWDESKLVYSKWGFLKG